MKISDMPFNISYVQDVPNTYSGMLPVQSLQIYEGKSGDFNPQGLYSNVIFGRQGEKSRIKRESFIQLKLPIFYPVYYQDLIKTKALYEEILMGTGYALWDEKEKDFVRADILTGETGFSFFVSHFKDLAFKRNGSKQRDQIIDHLEAFKKNAFITNLLVMPAGLRDIKLEDGRPVEEEVNLLYRKIISISNTVNVGRNDPNSSIYDGARAGLQKATTSLDVYLSNMLSGKKGLFQSKYAARRIKNSTRNVLSSMETGSAILGDERQPGVNTTVCGLYQFISGVKPYIVKYAIRRKYLADFINGLDHQVPLIDKKTLKMVMVRPTNKTRDQWGTDSGVENIINRYGEPELAHKPVVVDGMYLKLIYRDKDGFKVMSGIDELPDGYDRNNVTPMTWTELFYLHVFDWVKKTRAFVTRYPVTGLGSIYPSEVYLKTTVTGSKLVELDSEWNPSDKYALEFPSTKEKQALFQTMAVSPYRLSGLGADMDGDMLTLTILYGNESIAEIDAIMNEKSTYVSPDGKLRMPLTTDITEWVLSFMTGED